MISGAREKWFFQVWDITESRDHVVNEDIYKCGVDWAAGLAVKYVAKWEVSVMTRVRSDGNSSF